MNYEYTVDDSNVVKFFDLDRPFEDGSPFFYQECYPDQTPFLNRIDAEAWAEAKYKELTDENAPYASFGPSIETPQRITRREQELHMEYEARMLKPSDDYIMDYKTGNWVLP